MYTIAKIRLSEKQATPPEESWREKDGNQKKDYDNDDDDDDNDDEDDDVSSVPSYKKNVSTNDKKKRWETKYNFPRAPSPEILQERTREQEGTPPSPSTPSCEADLAVNRENCRRGVSFRQGSDPEIHYHPNAEYVDPRGQVDDAESETLSSNDIETVYTNDVTTVLTHVTNDPNRKNQTQDDEEEVVHNSMVRPEKNKEEGEDKTPKEEFGCVKGFVRDTHIKHGVLYFSIIIYLFARLVVAIKYAGVDCGDWRNDCHFFKESPGGANALFFVIYAVFLVEAFWLSSTYKYLKSINSTESILDYMERMYKTEPHVLLNMECYHYETRVSYHTDSNGNSYTTTHTVPVVTWTGSEEVNIVAWRDESLPINEKEIIEYQVTKVKLSKTFAGDDGYEKQRDSFIVRNRNRDAYFNFSVDLRILGYESHMMSFVDLNKKPEYLGFWWFVAAHVAILPSFPYRVWVSSITGKITPNIHKIISTSIPV